jgi:RHS repeat-associated protein
MMQYGLAYDYSERFVHLYACGQSHFTGKERDAESNLDNFGARYDASQIGRFLSPDIGIDQHPEDPRSWNLYSYVRNNPLTYVDPSGNYLCGYTLRSLGLCDAFQNLLDSAQTAANKLKDTYGPESKQYLDAQRAIDSYGDQDVDNGVTVDVGDTGGFPGTTQASRGGLVTLVNPTGQNILVKFAPGVLNAADANTTIMDVAHEGSHVADAEVWADSGFSDSYDPTVLGTESRAYGVDASLADVFGDTVLTASHGDKSMLFWNRYFPQKVNDGLTTGMVKTFYPNWSLKAFQSNTSGGSH